MHAHAVIDGSDDSARQATVALMEHECFVGTVPGAGWSPEAALDFMDARGISLQLLSMPGALDPVKAHAWNTRTADIIGAHPTRFGLLAALPMGEPDRAIAEVEWASKHDADGVAIASNYGGRYLGDAGFDGVFAAIERADLPVFVHPALPPTFDQIGLGRPGPLVEYPMDTARTALDAVYAGLFLRRPGIRMILAHAGGVLPALSERIALLGTQPWVSNPLHLTRTQLTDQLGAMYLDTAIGGGPATLAPALAMVGVEHMVFGTDFPPAGIDTIEATMANLEAHLSVADRQLMEETFTDLFPKAAARAVEAHL